MWWKGFYLSNFGKIHEDSKIPDTPPPAIESDEETENILDVSIYRNHFIISTTTDDNQPSEAGDLATSALAAKLARELDAGMTFDTPFYSPEVEDSASDYDVRSSIEPYRFDHYHLKGYRVNIGFTRKPKTALLRSLEDEMTSR